MSSQGFDPKRDAAVDEALKETFPASDPPAIAGDDGARRGDPTLHRPLSLALRDLHRALIMAEAADDGMLAHPFDLFEAVMRDPRFAWLRPLSTLIVELDEIGDSGGFAGPADLVPCRRMVEELVGPSAATDTAFRAAYLRCLQASPDLVLAHGALRERLAAIPMPPAT
ncbi:MAG: hypothetical protein AB7O45_02450 [Alphaproteobacteria bacterium]